MDAQGMVTTDPLPFPKHLKQVDELLHCYTVMIYETLSSFLPNGVDPADEFLPQILQILP
jgi:hypothetical protein